MSNQVEGLKYKKGEAIICEGERSDCAYIIEFGSAEVYKSLPNGEQQFLGVLAQGDIFGELGLIDGLPRSATVKALDNCRIRKLSQETFVSLAKQNPKALMPILKILASRLRQTLKLVDKLENRRVMPQAVSADPL
ncbi:MAG: cyclic nucleotide-binding domain-containing protein [Nitrospinae bacterium]|nr:cyclic nucleotide-binding domain-containing protein [Nitrospinota bacterium]MBL7021099.1 cyclic nucleotide-binding domain-containing protein [Nitrospinaceae bacterium]